MQAVVLAAGEAKHLRPLTARRPKGMFLVGGQPLLLHTLQALKDSGVSEAVLVVGNHAEKIQSFFKDGSDFGLRISYAHQTTPSGTADAIRHALPLVNGKGPVIVTPGDNYITAETLRPLLKAKQDTLLLSNSPFRDVHGVPTLKGTRLAEIREVRSDSPSTRVSTLLLRAGPKFLKALDDPKLDRHPDIQGFFNAYVQDGGVVETDDVAGPWEGIRTPWDLLRLNEHVLKDLSPSKVIKVPKTVHVQGAVQVGRHSTVAPTATLIGPVTIGEGCTVGDYSVVGPDVSVRNNSIIGAHCEIRRSILNNNVQVESRALLLGSILDDGVRIGPNFACTDTASRGQDVGCVIGADTELGADCRVASGTIVDCDRRVAPGTHLAPEA